MFLSRCSPVELERQVELALEMVVGGARDQHAAGLAQLLQPGGDVDAVAEQVVALDHHVAEIDADAEHDPPVRRRPRPVASATAFWTATAQATASTTEPNSTIAPSPISLTIRPWCSARSGSITSRRSALIAASVPASSCSTSRE